MKPLTALFLIEGDQVLLAMKKRGFGAGRWNGVGGKLEPGESVEEAVVRECQEEIEVTPISYKKMAEIIFDEQHLGKRELLEVNVFTCDEWQGEPTETEEMAPKWFPKDGLPFDEMWDDDKYWLPKVLGGETLKCYFVMDQNDTVTSHTINSVKRF